MTVRTYTPAELRQAHADLCTAFIAPGSCMPADIHTALEDDLWSRLITARAASNRYHARLRAGSISHRRIEYTQGDTMHTAPNTAIDLMGDTLTQLDQRRLEGSISRERHAALTAGVSRRVEQIVEFEVLLEGAVADGLSYVSASMEAETGELFLSVADTGASCWITRLTLGGYSFSEPVSTYKTSRGHAAEAIGPAGRRIVLEMLEHVQQVAA